MAIQWHEIKVDLVKEITEKSILIIFEGEPRWLPKSQISALDRGYFQVGDQDYQMGVSEWFMRKEGLL